MKTVVAILFWLSAAGIAYSYVGYGLLIALYARLWPKPVEADDVTPLVNVVVAAYNEEAWIAKRIENLLASDYPCEQLLVTVVTDGSNDGTMDLVQAYADQDARVTLLHQPERRGKAEALIRAVPLIPGEILVFTDANCFFTPEALRYLVRPFADPEVGGVGGIKRVVSDEDSLTGRGEGLYWRYESYLKQCDSAVSSVMGMPGEIMAARRQAYRPPEPDAIVEDFTVALDMVARGWRVIHEPRAVAYEDATPNVHAEWVRRSRIASGGWQAFFQLLPVLRHPQKRVVWQYLSHRMMRWMVTPSLWLVMLLSNILLVAAGQEFYRMPLALQILFYAVALVGGWLETQGKRIGILYAPFYVCLLNAAALVGGYRFLSGRGTVLWQRER